MIELPPKYLKEDTESLTDLISYIESNIDYENIKDDIVKNLYDNYYIEWYPDIRNNNSVTKYKPEATFINLLLTESEYLSYNIIETVKIREQLEELGLLVNKGICLELEKNEFFKYFRILHNNDYEWLSLKLSDYDILEYEKSFNVLPVKHFYDESEAVLSNPFNKIKITDNDLNFIDAKGLFCDEKNKISPQNQWKKSYSIYNFIKKTLTISVQIPRYYPIRLRDDKLFIDYLINKRNTNKFFDEFLDRIYKGVTLNSNDWEGFD
jgi:hypothetical protein